MNSKPLLSIISVTKDDAAGLRRTVESVAGLRAVGVEHAVVDGSLATVWELPADVVVIRREAKGIADAFNVGLETARGEWVWFLNGGDKVDPRLQPELLLALLGQSRADALVGATTYAGEDKPCPHAPVARRWPSLAPWIPHPSTLVRRSLFMRFGRFDERYSIVMDYEWCLRVLASDEVRVDVISVPFAVFAPGGISQRSDCRALLARERDDAIRRHQQRLWGLWLAAGGRLLKAWGRAQGTRRLGKASLTRFDP
jgi:glycosyltransferase involved in cell wall biosynthesis